MAMNTKAGKKQRGRTSITGSTTTSKNSTRRPTESEKRTGANRPMGTGVGHRGDRRDTHPAFSTGKKRGPGGKTKPSLNRGTRKN